MDRPLNIRIPSCPEGDAGSIPDINCHNQYNNKSCVILEDSVVWLKCRSSRLSNTRNRFRPHEQIDIILIKHLQNFVYSEIRNKVTKYENPIAKFKRNGDELYE